MVLKKYFKKRFNKDRTDPSKFVFISCYAALSFSISSPGSPYA